MSMPWKRAAKAYRNLCVGDDLWVTKLLRACGVESSTIGYRNWLDGDYVRIDAAIQQIRASLGQVTAVPKAQYDRTVEMLNYYVDRTEKADRLLRILLRKFGKKPWYQFW